MHVHILGKRYEVICTTCGIHQTTPNYTIALTTTKTHNHDIHGRP